MDYEAAKKNQAAQAAAGGEVTVSKAQTGTAIAFRRVLGVSEPSLLSPTTALKAQPKPTQGHVAGLKAACGFGSGGWEVRRRALTEPRERRPSGPAERAWEWRRSPPRGRAGVSDWGYGEVPLGACMGWGIVWLRAPTRYREVACAHTAPPRGARGGDRPCARGGESGA